MYARVVVLTIARVACSVPASNADRAEQPHGAGRQGRVHRVPRGRSAHP